MLDGEELARPPEAALDLVADEQDAALGQDFADEPEVVIRRDDDAALAQDRLGDEGGHVAVGVTPQRLGELLGAAGGALGVGGRAERSHRARAAQLT